MTPRNHQAPWWQKKHGGPAHARAASAAWILLALSATWLQAASTQVWELADYRDFLAGKFENVALSHEGRLSLAPKLEPIYASDQPVFWAAAAGPDGSTYLGSGHQGHIYKVDPEGKSQLFWAAPEIEVFAIAAAPDGTVYAGTSPKGKVYRIRPDGKAEEFFDPGETYIWSLAFGPAGDKAGGFAGPSHLFVGTGEGGKIYRVDAAGKSEVYFESGQRHVISLALDAEGRLLAGTDPNGVLYRIDEPGKAFALYDSDLPEIRGLQVSSSGDIYAAAMGGGISQIPTTVPATVSSIGGAGVTTISVTASADDGGPPGVDPSTAASAPTKQESQTSVTLAQPIISYGGLEKAALLRVRPGLAVEKLWSSTEENILALSLAEPEDGSVLFATDQAGRIYDLGPRRQVSLVAQTEQDQITQLVRTPAGLLLATAHTGKLYRLERAPATEGTYETAVRDTGGVSRWGRLSWSGEVAGGAGLQFQTRSGNSSRPDATWSGWSAPIRAEAGPDGAPISSPPARYIQWRAALSGSENDALILERVRLTYLPQNAPPVVKSIDVSTAAAAESAASDSSAGGSTASSDSASYSITVSASDDSSGSSATSADVKTIRGGAQQTVTISWQAEDPDGDPLTAAVEFRGEGEKTWKLLKKDLSAAKVAIDSDALADGAYRFRVTVSDRRANPAGIAQSAQRISPPVLVDHTPPAVRVARFEGRETVRFEASDQASILQHAEYSLDAGPWTPVYADDGITDSRQESFTIRLADLAEGEHLLTLRVSDRAGNAGLGKAVIR